ncbi:glycoside hydrolase family 88 protein [Mangrovibacterium diazotrophicum]|uniref:Glycosyl hydrolase family 88 n=1 Tax=Mangrovibacterium diazotrophicum TaxID=1261403 RepID=A0A419W5E4_9BACT|nr:glycoside hydrolase family 88 protein [Mangrovibacterium diazotrophicum]RKD90678.1 glycosyl hydrolase family 88 [Mangrovibacterium diazotrophicum]
MYRQFLSFLLLLGLFNGCATPEPKEKPLGQLVDESLEFATQHSLLMAESLKDQPDRLPQTIDKEGKLVTCNSAWWVSGFFPGVLWYLYENTPTDTLKDWATNYTMRVEDQKYTTDNHDVGFMIFCSFGNAYRLTGDTLYRDVIRTASNSLITRFNPTIGCIRSWDYAPWSAKWQYPVIIDNMMNLEMLEWASKAFDDTIYSHVAETHANTTLKNHFRDDFSSYHVVSYDTISGQPEKKNTAQGYSDDSAWARGQGWGLYGYTMMYRETGNEAYLKQAENIADFILNNPNLPEDKIPYWDFDAPDIPNAKRDASAGAIICSALIELSQYVSAEKSKAYLSVAEMQLRSLSSPAYQANLGENGNFILEHSVGHMPNGTEVDVPLTYADYYYVEALLRMKKLLNK